MTCTPSVLFFMDNFGRLISDSVDATIQSFERIASTSFTILSKSGFDSKTLTNGPRIPVRTTTRFSGGWLIVRPGGASVSLDLEIDALKMKTLGVDVRFSPLSFKEACERECTIWSDGEPRLFIQFSKALLSPHKLFLSLDRRAVRLCSPSGTLTQNWMDSPPKAKPRKIK